MVGGIHLRPDLGSGARRPAPSAQIIPRVWKGGGLRTRAGAGGDDGAGDGVLSWDDARKLADGDDRPTVTVPGRYTVAQAAEAYCATRSATGERGRHIRCIRRPKLGRKPVAELTTGDIEAWLAAQVPATADREARRAAQATANRRFNVLRAILNSAFRKDPARVPSDAAWRRVRDFEKTDKPRTRTLAAKEARRLLNALPPSLRALARGALYTGCRLGELQALTVADVADGRLRSSILSRFDRGRFRCPPME